MKRADLMNLHNEEVKMYLRRKHLYIKNKKRLYATLFGQCTPTLASGIKSQKDFSKHDDIKDVLWLTQTIRKLSVGIDANENEIITTHDALKRLYNLRQGLSESNDDYLERFKELWDTAVAAAGEESIVTTMTRTSTKYKSMSNDQLTEATKAVFLFIKADPVRYGERQRKVAEDVVLGVDKYPNDVDQAYAILNDTHVRQDAARLRTSRRQGQTNFQRNRSEEAIPDGEEVVMGTDRRVFTVRCHNCNRWGHYAGQCPEVSNAVRIPKSNVNENDTSLINYLLDTGSTHNTVNNKKDLYLLTNLFNEKVLHMRSSTGNVMKYTEKGILKPFNVEAFYNKRTAANILAFHTLCAIKDAYMVYDSRQGDCFRLVYKNGREAQFQNLGDGLYKYVNPRDNKNFNNTNESATSDYKQKTVQFVQTVSDNESLMTSKEIERAKLALDLQEYLGWPSVDEFIKIVQRNEAKNININVDDIKRAVHLYGIPSPYLKGRMTRRRPLRQDQLDFLQSPLPVELYDKRIELYMDIFYFGGMKFIIMESSRIKYIEIESISSESMTHIIPIVKKEINKYTARGLEITGVHIDNQFFNQEFENAIRPATLITYAADEHVSVIERRNRTVKERMRSILAGLPYQQIPKIMLRGLSKKVKTVINQFPVRKGGVSNTISPEEIVEGKQKIDLSKKRVNFGQYVEIHDGTTNTSSERAVGAIAMYPTNGREGYAFMCIDTGRFRHSNNWVAKPISEEVTDKVAQLAKDPIDVEALLQDLEDSEMNLLKRHLRDRTNNESNEHDNGTQDEETANQVDDAETDKESISDIEENNNEEDIEENNNEESFEQMRVNQDNIVHEEESVRIENESDESQDNIVHEEEQIRIENKSDDSNEEKNKEERIYIRNMINNRVQQYDKSKRERIDDMTENEKMNQELSIEEKNSIDEKTNISITDNEEINQEQRIEKNECNKYGRNKSRDKPGNKQ